MISHKLDTIISEPNTFIHNLNKTIMKTLTQSLNVILFVSMINVMHIGCSSDTADTMTRIDCLPCRVNDNDNWGFMTRDGHVILEDEFENEPSPVISGIFSLPTPSGYTVYRLSNDGNYFIVNSLENLASVGYFNDGLLPISRHDGMIEVVDENGKTKFSLTKIDGIDVVSCFSYREGIMPVMLADTTMVYVDTDGHWLFGQKFYSGTYFRGGHAVIEELLPKSESRSDKRRIAVIDTKGQYTFVPDNDYSLCGSEDNDGLSFHNGFIALERREKKYIYDLNGKLMCQCPASVEEIGYISSNMFTYSHDGNYGLMNFNCERIIRPHYEDIAPIGNYFIAIKDYDEEELLLIDRDDNVICSFEAEDAYLPYANWYDFPLVAETDDEMYLIDSHGKIMPQSFVSEIDAECIDDGYGAFLRFGSFDDNPGYVKASATATNIMLDVTMHLLGEGTGISTDSIAYFTSTTGGHCTPYQVNHIRTLSDRSKLLETNHCGYTHRYGDGYFIQFTPYFDEIIAYKSEYSDNIYLNPYAWCEQIFINHNIDNTFIPSSAAKRLVDRLKDKGCELQEEKSSGIVHGYLLLGTGGKNYIAVVSIDSADPKEHNLYCMVMQVSTDNRKKLQNWIENYISNN